MQNEETGVFVGGIRDTFQHNFMDFCCDLWTSSLIPVSCVFLYGQISQEIF